MYLEFVSPELCRGRGVEEIFGENLNFGKMSEVSSLVLLSGSSSVRIQNKRN